MPTNDKQVASLLGLLATDLPGCGESDKIAALERALIDFCRRSRCWRELATVTIAKGTIKGDLKVGCDALADSVRVIRVNGDRLRASRFPVRLGMDGDRSVLVLACGAAQCDWTVEGIFVLIPKRGQIDVADRIIDQWGDAIADGAKAALKNHFRKPYTDPAGAAVCERGFLRGIADACVAGAQLEQGMIPS